MDFAKVEVAPVPDRKQGRRSSLLAESLVLGDSPDSTSRSGDKPESCALEPKTPGPRGSPWRTWSFPERAPVAGSAVPLALITPVKIPPAKDEDTLEDSEAWLYLSGRAGAEQAQILNQLGISAIINATPEAPTFPSQFTTLNIPIRDCAGEDISEHFETVVRLASRLSRFQ